MDINFTGKYEWKLIDEFDNVVDSGEEHNVVTDDLKYIFFNNTNNTAIDYGLFNQMKMQLYTHQIPIQNSLNKDIRTFSLLANNVVVGSESPRSSMSRTNNDTQFYYIYNFDKPTEIKTYTSIGLYSDYNTYIKPLISYLEFSNPITQHTNERLYVKYVLNMSVVPDSGSQLIDNIFSDVTSTIPLWYADILYYKQWNYSHYTGVYSYLTIYNNADNIGLIGPMPYTTGGVSSYNNQSNSSLFGMTYNRTLDNSYANPIGTVVSNVRPGVASIYNTSSFLNLIFKYSPATSTPTISRSFKHASGRLLERWSDVDHPPQSKGSIIFSGTPTNKLVSTQHIEFVKSGMSSDIESEQSEYFLYEHFFYNINKHIVSIDVDNIHSIDDFNNENVYNNKVISKEMHLDNWTYTIQNKYDNLWLCVWNKGTIEMSEGLEDIGISVDDFIDIIYVNDNEFILFTTSGNKVININDDKTYTISDYVVSEGTKAITFDVITNKLYVASNTTIGLIYVVDETNNVTSFQLDGGMNDTMKSIRHGQFTVYNNILCRGGSADKDYSYYHDTNLDRRKIWFYDITNDIYQFIDTFNDGNYGTWYVRYYDGYLYILDSWHMNQWYTGVYLRKYSYDITTNTLTSISTLELRPTTWYASPLIHQIYNYHYGNPFNVNDNRIEISYVMNNNTQYKTSYSAIDSTDSWHTIDYNPNIEYIVVKYGWDSVNNEWVKWLDTPRKTTTGTHQLLNGLNCEFNNATGVTWDTNFIQDESVAVTTGLIPISDNLQTHEIKFRYLHCKFENKEATLTMGTTTDGDGYVSLTVPETSAPSFRDMDSNQDAANSGIGMVVSDTATGIEYTFKAKADVLNDDNSYYADTSGNIFMNPTNSGKDFDIKYTVTYF